MAGNGGLKAKKDYQPLELQEAREAKVKVEQKLQEGNAELVEGRQQLHRSSRILSLGPKCKGEGVY
jgi:hypothetical protein